ncbi:helix-turn-helix domain-containing protein [Candidimonas humi]|uniref:Helix-turn-helix domain-containing protein n=1 Tax=Candidimonas humi TaxID=683355 RepID=A0ABV8NZL1_9BURK|nr:helix-turn-helix transcriptional regulator [Candidimonas humi]MBV6306308.1 helix-turn-helix domain-containing protein [Candidimonas humi]
MTAKMQPSSRGSIGERLIIARKKRGLSQDALARLLTPPVSQGAIAHIESGRIESSRHLVWIAAALKIRAEWLVTGEGDMFEMPWPWPEMPQYVVEQLPASVLEDIGDYIKMKINQQARHNKDQT